jgi:L-aminopeptidase/D-esterase-like protein
MNGLTAVSGIRVGHVSDRKGLTGCTVIRCEGAVAGVDVRGSATGTEEIDTLQPGHVAPQIHALTLAGGSAFGLEAASGVRQFLEAQGIGFPTRAAKVPIVPAAIIYDLAIGDGRSRPTREMGHAAAKAAHAGPVEEGCVGAGTGATVGKVLGIEHAMKSGIGSHAVQLTSRVVVASLVVLNAWGDVRDPSSGRILAGARTSPNSREFADAHAVIKRGAASAPFGRENTTLAVVATNAALTKVEATKLAQLAQLGLARTIFPVHTMADGDVAFALSLGKERAPLDALGVAAAESVAQAVVRAAMLAKSLGGLPGLAG